MRSCAAILLASGLAAVLRAADTVLVFAAASTTDALGEIAKTYEAATGTAVVCSFAASSTLARQIEAGAPADIFLSADEAWMDHVEKAAALRTGTRRDLLGNRLVLVAAPESTVAVEVREGFDLAAAISGRFAIGDPTHVPAGRYARDALVSLGWWDALQPRLAPAADVRAALRLVEVGEAEVGMVYASDAVVCAGVRVVASIPEDRHRPIRYPVALTATAKPAAAGFLAYLGGAEAAAVWTARGFTVIEAP